VHDVVDVRVQNLKQTFLFMTLQSLDYKLLIVRKEEEAAALALRFTCLKHIVPIFGN
jgi:hypothetical protein